MTLNLTTNTYGDYKVRIANKCDAKVVIDMLVDAAGWLKNKGVNQWSYLDGGKENQAITEAIITGTTYVMEDGTKNIVASFNLSSEQNNWDKELWGITDDSAVYLHRLVVAPEQHNKEIGKELLNWIVENTDRKFEAVRLDCVGHNQVLNRFYQKAGFTFAGSHDMSGEWFSKYERTLR